MDQYQTFGVMDETALKEIGKYLAPRSLEFADWVVSLLFLYSTISSFVQKDLFYTIFYGVGCILSVTWAASFRKLIIKSTLKPIRENSSEGVYRCESFFTEDGLFSHNLSTNEEVLYRFDVLTKAAETKNYFFLKTKAGQFSLVFKDCLTPEQRDSFLPFLKEKCPNLKIMR